MCSQSATRLDTLELTSDYESSEGQSSVSSTLSNRQRSKAVTKAINGKLCYLNSSIHKDYQQAYYCNDILQQDGLNLRASYCRKRNCLVCARIAGAKRMKAYGEALLSLPDLHLVTLTNVNVKDYALSEELSLMAECWYKLKDNIRATHKIKLVGMRKLEITYSHRNDDFNPHYHVLVSGRKAADLVRAEWLRLNTTSRFAGQDVTPVLTPKALLEVFKYVTKTIVKDTFSAVAMDAMYRAIKGVRTIQPMGGVRKQEVNSEVALTTIDHKGERIDVWKWCNKRYDWYSITTSEKLNTTFVDPKTKELINVIDRSNGKRKKHESSKRTGDRSKACFQVVGSVGGRRYSAVHVKRSGLKNVSRRLVPIDRQVLLIE